MAVDHSALAKHISSIMTREIPAEAIELDQHYDIIDLRLKRATEGEHLAKLSQVAVEIREAVEKAGIKNYNIYAVNNNWARKLRLGWFMRPGIQIQFFGNGGVENINGLHEKLRPIF